MYYRQKTVKAHKFESWEKLPDWLKDNEKFVRWHTDDPYEEFYIIKNLEGKWQVNIGDYIIQGISDELSLCEPDIFEKTYELAWK